MFSCSSCLIVSTKGFDINYFILSLVNKKKKFYLHSTKDVNFQWYQLFVKSWHSQIILGRREIKKILSFLGFMYITGSKCWSRSIVDGDTEAIFYNETLRDASIMKDPQSMLHMNGKGIFSGQVSYAVKEVWCYGDTNFFLFQDCRWPSEKCFNRWKVWPWSPKEYWDSQRCILIDVQNTKK